MLGLTFWIAAVGNAVAATNYTLIIAGSPGNYDSPTNLPYGTYTNIADDTWITNSVTSPADASATQRWTCLGWDLTNIAASVTNATTTQAVFQLTTNLWLTWNWTNEYLLTVSASPGGTVTTNMNGWYTNGLSVTGITATASNGWPFVQWTGNVPSGMETDNPLIVTMNQARVIQAGFGYTLTINGNPGNYGSPTPLGYGTNNNVTSNAITNSVSSPANETNGVRRACIGWALTNAAGSVTDDTGTQAVFQVTTNMFLTWNWTNEYQLAVSAGPDGTATTSSNGWHTNGAVVGGITATASNGYQFLQWTGDVSADDVTNNPLTVTMDRWRVIQANFCDTNTSSETKTWTGTGKWESYTNWSPVGMPNTIDDVVIKSGSVVLDNTTWIASLTVSNSATLTIGGETYDSNAIVVEAAENITVYGTITVVGEYTIAAPADPNCGYPDGHGHTLKAKNISILIGGKIYADGKGYRADGTGGGPGGTKSYGASYGYGDANNPLALGSASGQNNGNGGGAIKLEVGNTLTVEGSLSANGVKGADANGGSGGSLYINCGTLAGSSNITANGGDGGISSGQGAGGGGRIYINCATNNFDGIVSAAGGFRVGLSGVRRETLGTLVYSPNFDDSGLVVQGGGFGLIPGNYNMGPITVKDNSILRLCGSSDAYGSNRVVNINASSVDINTGSKIFAEGDTDTNYYAYGRGPTIKATNITMNGGIYADCRGFPGGQGPGDAGGYSGGSYGGKGAQGAYGSPVGKPTYGDPISPLCLGSGGYGTAGYYGGGAIKLEVTDSLIVNAPISANGYDSNNGASSGGSIFIMAKNLSGSSNITANGGNGGTVGGGGGGGRVSIEYSSSTWSGTVSVAGGAGRPGYPGTYFSCESVCLGAGSSGYNGITLSSDLSKDGGDSDATNGVKLTRFVTIWNPSRPMLSWRDTSTDLDTNQLDNVVTNSLSGLAVNMKHKIYYDGQWTNTLTSDASGNLTNIVITLDAEHTILVEGPARGTAIIVM